MTLSTPNTRTVTAKIISEEEGRSWVEIPTSWTPNTPGNQLPNILKDKIEAGQTVINYQVSNLVKNLIIAGNKWSKNKSHIKKIENLFSYPVDKVNTVTDFLSRDTNSKQVVEDILNSDGNKLIIGHMGTGKSTSVISLGAVQNLKIIFAVPLIVNVDQFFSKHKKEKGISRIRKQNAKAMAKILDNENNNVIICTYDRVEKISAYLSRYGQINKWILVMDEAHNLVSQSNYRQKALRKFLYNSVSYSKLILLTGTPDVLMYPLLKSKIDFVSYEFKKAISTFNKGSFKTLYTEYLDPTAILLMNLLSDEGKSKKGLRIIVQENITRLNELKDLLIEHGLAIKEEIYILNSKAKDSEGWDELVTNSRLNPGIKYFLSTSVISDGCNIENTNVIEFYSINWFDLTKLRQMQSRLRKASNDLIYYDIIRLSKPLAPPIPKGFIDIDRQHEIENALRDALCNIISIYSDSSFYGEEFESFFKDNTVYGLNDIVCTDIFAIYQVLCNVYIYSPLSSYPELRHEFTKSFFNIDPTKVELECVTYVDKNVSRNLYEKREVILKQKYDELMTELESSHKKVFKYLDIIEGAREPEQIKNLRQERTFELLENPFLRQIGNWFRELYNLNISKDACKLLFEILKEHLIKLNIGSDVTSMNERYDNPVRIEVFEPFIVMRICQMLYEGTSNIKNQEDREFIITALLENIKNHGNKYVNAEITNNYPSIVLADLKLIEDYLFISKKTSSNKLYMFKIESARTIKDLFNDLRINISEDDLNYLISAGWY